MNTNTNDLKNNTDLGNMRRYTEQAEGFLHFIKEKKAWIHYNGKYWSLADADLAVSTIAEKTIMGIYDEAGNNLDLEARRYLGEHALRSESSQRINAMIRMAKPKLQIDYNKFDQDPMLLNVENGTINLNTGELLNHDKSHYISKIIPADYDPDAKCPHWLEFLNLIMNGNSDMVNYLQRAVGYCLTGRTGERCLFILYGDGRNGKSTFTENIASLLGDYALHTSSETLLQKKWEGIPVDLARLCGARFVYASETAQNRQLNEARIKALTGDKDTITARFLYKNEFSYIPTFKIWLHTNHKPRISGTEQAIWDRIKLIPFDVRIPDDKIKYRDEIDEMFKAERSGILSWAVQGCLDWQKYGLGHPDTVLESTGQYRQEVDPLKGFLEEICVIDQSLNIAKTELYNIYEKWCFENEELDRLKEKKFNKIIKDRGFQDYRETTGDKKMMWKGIGIKNKKIHTNLKRIV